MRIVLWLIGTLRDADHALGGLLGQLFLGQGLALAFPGGFGSS